jgi:hypothetical protein
MTARADLAQTLEHAAELVERTGAGSYAPLVFERRAQLELLDGRVVPATAAMREALRLYTDMGATWKAQRVEHRLKEIAS